MRLAPWLCRFASGFLAVALLQLSACSGSDTPEPAYAGCATDENWRTFDDYLRTSRLESDAANTPVWQDPAEGEIIAAASSPDFRWQPNSKNAGATEGNASCGQVQPQHLGIAPLHEPPVSGTVYDLHFVIEGTEAYRLLTTRQTARVPSELWQSWAGRQVSVSMYRAELLRNDVVQGLFQAPTLHLSVQR